MANSATLRLLSLFVILVTTGAFNTISRNSIRLNTNAVNGQTRFSNVILYSKKEKTEAKGFSVKKVKPVPVVIIDSDTEGFGEGMVPSSSSMSTTAKPIKRFESETDADAIFKKYGIKDGEGNKTKSATKKKKTVKKNKKGEVEENPFGQSVLAGITPEAQMKIDNTLVTCVGLALGFVVLSGISISLGAYTVVFPETKIPAQLDFVITNFLSPAFTPALGVFFFFSTTFGLFKFAQISSDQTVYKEQVTRDL